MSQIEEKVVSRMVEDNGVLSRVTVHYLIWEVASELEALNLLRATAPPGWSDNAKITLLRGTLVVDPLPVMDGQGQFAFNGIVEYKNPKRANQPYCLEEFDTTGGSERITQSIRCISDSNTRADFRWLRGAINVDGKGRVNGLEIVSPKYMHTERCRVESSVITTEYKRLLRDYTGTVNKLAFKQWDPGEALFLGCRGTEAEDSWDLVLQWEISKNADLLTIGEGTDWEIPIIDPTDPESNLGPAELRPDIEEPFQSYAKLGHEYGWTYFEEGKGFDGHRVPLPQDVYIEQVYEYEDHNDITGPLEPPLPL